MVVVAAIEGDHAVPSARVIDAVATGDVQLAVSDDQLSELVRVMGYAGVEDNIGRPLRAFDLAHAAGADYIVSYDGAVRDAASELGFVAIPPEELLEVLHRQYEP